MSSMSSTARSRLVEVAKSFQSNILISAESISSSWFKNQFKYGIEWLAAVDYGVAPQDYNKSSFSVPFLFLQESFSTLDIASIKNDVHPKKITWSYVGHYSLERTRDIYDSVERFGADGFFFLPNLRNVNDSTKTIGFKKYFEILSSSNLNIWSSHHSFPHHEALRTLFCLKNHCVPVRISKGTYEHFSDFPWVYSDVEHAYQAINSTGILESYVASLDFFTDFGLFEEHVSQCFSAILNSPRRYIKKACERAYYSKHLSSNESQPKYFSINKMNQQIRVHPPRSGVTSAIVPLEFNAHISGIDITARISHKNSSCAEILCEILPPDFDFDKTSRALNSASSGWTNVPTGFENTTVSICTSQLIVKKCNLVIYSKTTHKTNANQWLDVVGIDIATCDSHSSPAAVLVRKELNINILGVNSKKITSSTGESGESYVFVSNEFRKQYFKIDVTEYSSFASIVLSFQLSKPSSDVKVGCFFHDGLATNYPGSDFPDSSIDWTIFDYSSSQTLEIRTSDRGKFLFIAVDFGASHLRYQNKLFLSAVALAGESQSHNTDSVLNSIFKENIGCHKFILSLTDYSKSIYSRHKVLCDKKMIQIDGDLNEILVHPIPSSVTHASFIIKTKMSVVAIEADCFISHELSPGVEFCLLSISVDPSNMNFDDIISSEHLISASAWAEITKHNTSKKLKLNFNTPYNSDFFLVFATKSNSNCRYAQARFNNIILEYVNPVVSFVNYFRPALPLFTSPSGLPKSISFPYNAFHNNYGCLTRTADLPLRFEPNKISFTHIISAFPVNTVGFEITFYVTSPADSLYIKILAGPFVSETFCDADYDSGWVVASSNFITFQNVFKSRLQNSGHIIISTYSFGCDISSLQICNFTLKS
ncbi:hypothetical protein [Fundidesulfovibrio agrisoli]|uniref:hypothetical protein n=1 Tax=Fundidesulfovibrio agrisoli TaxID=2922717 RepID=UPI001FAB7E66|nr:hypothetical protein [Fundidesulfovibrio agrisoli]